MNPYLSGIHNVKQPEVNFIRPVDGLSGEEVNCVDYGSPKMFSCWIIEFSLKVDITKKLVNGISSDQAMTQGNDFHSKIISLKCNIYGKDYEMTAKSSKGFLIK